MRAWLHVQAWIACGSLLLGCHAFDQTLLEEDSIETPALGRDGGQPQRDAGRSRADCSKQPERCNGLDDDCDGEIDEDAADSCRLAHAVAACSSEGRCVLVECAEGYLDCNMRTQDGCEQDTREPGCSSCGSGCATDAGKPPATDGSTVETGDVSPADAGGPLDASTPSDRDAAAAPDASEGCVASVELCNQLDDDCDGKVDEAPADCSVSQCVASAPSYRGPGCDQCVCERCAELVASCQNSDDPTWSMLCRDVTECYVTHSLAGECGNNEDCYGTGNGPCAGQINLAAGGSSERDTSHTVSGCSASTPPRTACAALTNYRDQCIRDACAAECGQ